MNLLRPVYRNVQILESDTDVQRRDFFVFSQSRELHLVLLKVNKQTYCRATYMTTRAIRNQKAYFRNLDLLGGATVTLGGSILRDETSFQQTDSGEGQLPTSANRKLF